MQSSFNVIKNSRVIELGDKEIKTQPRKIITGEVVEDNYRNTIDDMESFENIAGNILEHARLESKKIIAKAYVDSAEIKQQAFQEGLENGRSEGYEKGYNEAMETSKVDAQAVRTMANNILMEAKIQYNKYLVDKQGQIKSLIVTIAENILKREVLEKEALNEMIFNTLKAERDIKSYIIKSNNSHFESIVQQIEDWKRRLAFQGDIFVIEDDFLDDGTAVIEKDTGKSIVSIAYGIEKVIEIMQEEQI